MGELGLNKIFGALLAAALLVLGLKTLSDMVFSDGGGHHDAHYDSLNDWAEHSFAYRVDMADTGGSEEVEEVYDLGLLLASADASRGERSFKGKCSTCHTIDQGGANGTGPNLYASIGVAKQHVAGFNYSGALATVGGDWTYENMDEWLRAPSRYARGTSMAFAGVSRDSERADLIAYLASYTPNAPAFPEPLPDEPVLDEAAIDGALVEEAAGELAATDETVIEVDAAQPAEPAIVESIPAPVADMTETVVDGAEDLGEAAAETVEDAIEAAEDAGEAIVEEATDGQ